MAGSTVAVTRSSNFNGLARDTFYEIIYLSDDADGSVPDAALVGLSDCILVEATWKTGTAAPENTLEIRIEDAAEDPIYLSGSIAADAFSRIMTTGYTGNWPYIDGPVTVKLVSPADHESACNIGNAKNGTLKLRFGKKS